MADAKAIFVDWNSLFFMLKSLGIGKTKDPVLLEILTKEMGEASKCFGKPVLVLWSNQLKDNTRGKYLEKVVGYEVVGVEKEKGGEDDLEIIKRIEALSPEDVSEIILVSCDVMDFLPCLRAKIALGIKVYLLATKSLNSQGNSMLTSLVDLPLENIQFVELADHKERIIREPWIDKPYKDKASTGIDDLISPEEEVKPPAVNVSTGLGTTRIMIISLEVAEEDFGAALTAVTPILQSSLFIKSVMEIKRGYRPAT